MIGWGLHSSCTPGSTCRLPTVVGSLGSQGVRGSCRLVVVDRAFPRHPKQKQSTFFVVQSRLYYVVAIHSILSSRRVFCLSPGCALFCRCMCCVVGLRVVVVARLLFVVGARNGVPGFMLASLDIVCSRSTIFVVGEAGPRNKYYIL